MLCSVLLSSKLQHCKLQHCMSGLHAAAHIAQAAEVPYLSNLYGVLTAPVALTGRIT